ncbi:MAG: outer membrane beta-barrel protein [Cytophagaceae bacterium]|nr:outer membrane beta-barrel protein [Cytophagaceae bacterium]
MHHNDEIENIFRNRFEDSEHPVSDRVWENIQKTLPPENSSPARPWYYSPLAIVAGLVITASTITGIAIYSSDNNESQEISIAQNENAEDIINSNKSGRLSENDNSINVNRNELANTKDVVSDNSVTTNYNGNEDKANNDIYAVNDKNERVNKNINDKSRPEKVNVNRDSRTDNNKEFATDDKILKGNKILNTETVNTADVKLTDNNNQVIKTEDKIKKDQNYISENKETAEDKVTDKTENEETVVQNNSENKLNKENTVTDNSEIVSETTINKDLSTSYNTTALTNNSDTLLNKELKKDSLLAEEKTDAPDTTTEAKKEEKTKRGWNPLYAELVVGPGFAYRNISGDEALVNNRNQYEDDKTTFNGGIRFNYALTRSLSIGTGLVFSGYGEKYKFDKQYEGEWKYNGYWYQDTSTGNNDPIFVKTDSFYTKRPDVNYSSRNYYRYMSIPVFVNYAFGQQKLRFNLGAGFASSVLLAAHTSRLHDSTYAVISESSSGESNPFRKVNLSFMVMPGVIYDVNNKLKLLFEMQYTQFINSIYQDNYPVQLRPYSLEVKVGVRYLINNRVLIK